MNKNSGLGRNYWSFLIGRFVHQFCSGAMLFGISVWILKTMENGAAKAAFFMAPGSLLSIILPPLIAPVADRACKRKLMLMSDLVSILPLATLLSLSFAEVLSFPILCLLFWIYSSVRAVFNSASNAVLPQMVEMTKLGQAQVYLQASGSVLMILSGLVGAYLASVLPLWQLMGMAGIGVFVSMFAVFLIRLSDSVSDVPPATVKGINSWWTDLSAGWKYIIRVNVLWQLIGVLALANILIGPVTYLVEVFILRDLALSAKELGYTVFSSAIGILISTLIYKKAEKKLKSWKLIVLWLCLMSPIYFIAASLNSVWGLMVFCALLGACFTFVNVPVNVLIMSAVEPQYRSRVLNLSGFFAGASLPLMILIYGAALEYINTAKLFYIISSLTIIPLPFLWRNRLLNHFMKLETGNIAKWCERLYRPGSEAKV